jgi:pyruvate kinase
MAFSTNIEETIKRVSNELLKQDLVRKGTPIGIVSDVLSDHFGANSILLHHA